MTMKYVDPDDPWGDDTPKRPKWATPKVGSWQAKILSACRRSHYKDRNEQSAVNEIAKAIVPLKAGISDYPEEWVNHCLGICKDNWREGKPMPLKGLLSYINNKDRKAQWLTRYNLRGGLIGQDTSSFGYESLRRNEDQN